MRLINFIIMLFVVAYSVKLASNVLNRWLSYSDSFGTKNEKLQLFMRISIILFVIIFVKTLIVNNQRMGLINEFAFYIAAITNLYLIVILLLFEILFKKNDFDFINNKRQLLSTSALQIEYAGEKKKIIPKDNSTDIEEREINLKKFLSFFKDEKQAILIIQQLISNRILDEECRLILKDKTHFSMLLVILEELGFLKFMKTKLKPFFSSAKKVLDIELSHQRYYSCREIYADKKSYHTRGVRKNAKIFMNILSDLK